MLSNRKSIPFNVQLRSLAALSLFTFTPAEAAPHKAAASSTEPP
jgi:hypothetical protein